MAEDKKIRISADASPLQELRQNAQSLWSDFSKMENSFKDVAEQTVSIIQKQVDLLKERNNLLTVSGGGQGNDRNISLIDPYTGRPLNGGTVVSPGASSRAVPNQLVERQVNVLDKILAEVVRVADVLEKEGRDDTNGVLPNNGGGAPPVLPPTSDSQIPSSPENNGGFFANFGKNFKLPTSLGGLMGLLPFGAAIMGIGTILGQQARYSAQQYGAENEFQRRNNLGNHWLLNMLTFGISGAEAEKKEVNRLAASQYDRSLGSYVSLHNLSYQQGIGRTLRGMFGNEIESGDMFQEKTVEQPVGMSPATADAYAATGLTDAIASLFGKNKNLQKKVYDPSETRKITSFNMKEGDEDEYHNWASRTLGLNITDYLDKYATLERAGVYRRNTGEINDPNSSINQLLMAGRIRGLSEEDMASVLQTTRFDTSGRTGANIVQTFDTNLQRLGKDDQYIASTLGEYLGSFNRVSESILDKTGSINSGNILRSMTSIQNATGMEGRQLERVQNALMGGSISQDEVSQALLMRTARELAGPDANLSDVQAKMEQMQQDPELQKTFFERIQKTSGGGEMSRQMMKAIFPQLSMTDIIALEKSTGNDAKKIFESGISRGAAYSEENAASKVGAAELSTAGTTNRKIVNGINEVTTQAGMGGIKEALESIEKPIPVTVVRAPSNSAGSGQSFIGPMPFDGSMSSVVDELKGLRKDLKSLTLNIEG